MTAPGGKTILANIIRPDGAGPFPVVVLLHGQSGFSRAYLTLGAQIAQSGYVTVVGCWFAGNYDGSSTVDPPTQVTLSDGIECPNGPTLKSLTSSGSASDVAALITAAKTLPNVRSDRLALVGNSRGSIVALLTDALTSESIQAIVAIGGAPPGGALLATRIHAAVLLIQGEADSVIPISYARDLEQALLFLGKNVESEYYPNHGHGILFDTPRHADAMNRMAAFLSVYLKN